MPKAVSNASPLIHLAAIGRFQLLRVFFDEICVPPAVWREIVEQGRGRAGAAEVQEAAEEGWMRVVALHSRFRHDQNLARTETKLRRLLSTFPFGPMSQSLAASGKPGSFSVPGVDRRHGGAPAENSARRLPPPRGCITTACAMQPRGWRKPCTNLGVHRPTRGHVI